MTCRRLLFAHIRSVAIGARTGFLVLLEFLFNRHDLWIRRLLVVFMARHACRNRDVRRQSAQCAGARNVYVAGRAFHYVLAFSTFVIELC